eukprot:TRINITY_DN1980_c0_g1_i4.p4 TRINITY_DN1980_c0_g1~~TRINITY_DN1980_c0_g1_i4.p4  ORF type:complete len:63 (-),score=13.97 TRINITY_DN1980_c0_g1_i4:416-604(-)
MAHRQKSRASDVADGVIVKSLFAVATGILAIATGGTSLVVATVGLSFLANESGNKLEKSDST